MASSPPAVSIIIPTYNRAEYLVKAVESVRRQSYSNFELLVIDDGSLDRTKNMIENILDHRIRYAYQNNAGPSAARNTGLNLSTGEYIAFLDSDDEYFDWKLQVQVAYLNEHPEVDLVASGWVETQDDGTVISEQHPWESVPRLDTHAILLGPPFVTGAIIVKTEWLRRVRGFDVGMHRAEDWDLWLRLASQGCRMEWLQSKVCTYRMHNSNNVRNARERRDSYLHVIDKFFRTRSDHDSSLVVQVEEVYANTYLKSAGLQCAAGLYREGCDDLAEAIRRDPSLLNQEGEAVFRVLTGWAQHAIAASPVKYVKEVFDLLPPEAGVVRARESEASALGEMVVFYRARRHQQWVRACLAFVRASAKDPSWLQNRGAVIMALDAMLGGWLLTTRQYLGSWRAVR